MWYFPTHPHNTPWLGGLQIYDREGALVYESAYTWIFRDINCKYIETVLEEGERIVGIKSHTHKDYKASLYRSSF